MRPEAGKISNAELLFLMVGFILGSSVLFSPGRYAAQMGWVAVLMGMVEGMLFAWIYVTIFKLFPGQTLIEINEKVFGKVIGLIISGLLILYFFHLGSMAVRIDSDFIKLALLPVTPVSIILLCELLAVGYVAWSGIEVLGRCSQGLVILTITISFLNLLLLIFKFHLQNFLPFNVPLSKLGWATHSAAAFPFGEIVVFTMIFPYINQKKKLRITIFKGLLMGGLLLCIASIRSIGVLGKSADIFLYPNYHVLKIINIGGVVNRVEILGGFNFLWMSFLKIGLLLYASSLGIAQLFKLENYRNLILPVGVLMFLLALLNFGNVQENVKFIDDIYPIYVLPFQVFIPLITLITAKLRGLSRGGLG